MLIAGGDSFLSGFETETRAQFEKECLQMIKEGGFEIGLAVGWLFGEPGEFENIGVAHECGDGSGRVLRASPADDCFLIRGKAGALVKKRSDLALELADRPISLERFDFVKGPLERIVDADQFDELCPGEPQQMLGRERLQTWIELANR